MNYFISTLILLMSINTLCAAQKALTIVPVADLLGEPLPHEDIKTMPVCGATYNRFQACPRMHQLLLHEVVTILKHHKDHVLVQVPNVFFVTTSNNHKRDTYWTHKNNLVMLDELTQDDLAKIPAPISYKTGFPLPDSNTTITLKQPFFDATKQLHYSAGTRFTVLKKTKRKYISFVFDARQKKFTKVALPKKICLRRAVSTFTEKRKQFVEIARSWTKNNDGFIPYVWGGCSMSTRQTGSFYEDEHLIDNKRTSFFALTNDTSFPKCGLDCTGLVCRAAQLCGIPFFYKNTVTFARFLKPLGADDTLQEGDIIWIPWHVMIVGSLEKNTIIEARSYTSGYGRVQEIPIGEIFKGIETYEQLRTALTTKKTLYRMDTHGTVRDTIREFKVLKLDSVVA